MINRRRGKEEDKVRKLKMRKLDKLENKKMEAKNEFSQTKSPLKGDLVEAINREKSRTSAAKKNIQRG